VLGRHDNRAIAAGQDRDIVMQRNQLMLHCSIPGAMFRVIPIPT
jgi:hypothetical protein